MSDTPWPPAPLRLPDEPLSDGVASLDPLVAADAEALARACDDPEIKRWLPFPDPYTLDDARAFIDSVPDLAARGEQVTLALRPAGSRDLAGATGFSCGDLHARGVAGIGYWTAAPFRRRGLAWRGVRLMAAWAAETMPDLRRLELLVQPGNHWSRKVAERAGATFEGVRRRGLVLHGRGVVDAAVYSLLPEELAVAPIDRPGAYGVVRHPSGDGRVLLVRWREHYFLPGGGLEPGEEPEAALRRELREETGFAARSALPLGNAGQHTVEPTTGRPVTKRCTFFLVEVAEPPGVPADTDHASEWVPLDDAPGLLHEEASVWAVERARRLTRPT